MHSPERRPFWPGRRPTGCVRSIRVVDVVAAGQAHPGWRIRRVSAAMLPIGSGRKPKASVITTSTGKNNRSTLIWRDSGLSF